MQGLGQPVVIDLGQSMVRCGFSGQNQPKSSFPTVFGVPKYHDVFLEKSYFAGEQAVKKRGLLRLNYPIEHGEIKSLEGVTQILSHCYENQLKTSSHLHPILLTCPPRTSKKMKQELTEIIFEKLNIPKYYLVNPALLSMYASYKRAGLFVAMGQTVTQTYVNFQGFPLPQGSSLYNIGGKDLTSYMGTLLGQTPLKLGISTFDLEIAKDYKESQAYIALDYQKQLAAAKNIKQNKTYELKDCSMIQVGAEAFKCPQALFNPKMMGKQVPSLPQIVYQAIKKCDMDVRRTLLQNIVISGGSTIFPGFCERMRRQIASLAPTNVGIIDFADRKDFTWKGGSILAAMPQHKDIYLWKQHYDQYGASIVHRCQCQ